MPEQQKVRGAISAGTSYPLPEFLRLAGFGRKTLAKAKREGLPVTRVGRNAFIDGDDWIAFCKAKARKAGAAR
ncbi:MAG: hypothetical protein U0805_11445 [Pirellulales bacterium]